MYGATFIQAARGPIMLMTLGVLLAIHQNTSWGFKHTFPILIIVFGVMKLLERAAVPPLPDTPPAPPPSPSNPGGTN